MEPLTAAISVTIVAVFFLGSVWLWKIGAISQKAFVMAVSLALVVASVLYWISEGSA